MPRRRRAWRTPSCAADSSRYASAKPGARVLSVDREMLRHQPVRADLDLGLVLDIDCRIAGEPRSPEQRDIVAPRYERPLEEAAAGRPATFHQGLEAFRISGLEGDPAQHVDPAEEPGGVGAMVDVALVNVALAAGAGAMKQIAVAGAVDRHPGADRQPAFLALEHGASDPILLDDRRWPIMEHEMDACAEHHISWLSSFRCSGSIVGDQVTMPWKAAVRSFQYAAVVASALPQSERGGPATASRGSRSRSSAAAGINQLADATVLLYLSVFLLALLITAPAVAADKSSGDNTASQARGGSVSRSSHPQHSQGFRRSMSQVFSAATAGLARSCRRARRASTLWPRFSASTQFSCLPTVPSRYSL